MRWTWAVIAAVIIGAFIGNDIQAHQELTQTRQQLEATRVVLQAPSADVKALRAQLDAVKQNREDVLAQLNDVRNELVVVKFRLAQTDNELTKRVEPVPAKLVVHHRHHHWRHYRQRVAING